eukprot:365139-Chlamydomonas_euryale.AAC.28
MDAGPFLGEFRDWPWLGARNSDRLPPGTARVPSVRQLVRTHTADHMQRTHTNGAAASLAPTKSWAGCVLTRVSGICRLWSSAASYADPGRNMPADSAALSQTQVAICLPTQVTICLLTQVAICPLAQGSGFAGGRSEGMRAQSRALSVTATGHPPGLCHLEKGESSPDHP